MNEKEQTDLLTPSSRPEHRPSRAPAHQPAPPGTPPIRTQKRGATILPNFVGLRFAVHNGKTYQEFSITEEMVGRKLGEYVAYVLPLCLAYLLCWFAKFENPRVIRVSSAMIGNQDMTDLLVFTFRTRKRFTYKMSKNK
ncbi:37S ribosomal protein S19 [Penicillium alfredii]|uniref:37S ribosomal protein S19 n=1 Tax=Penicillium alfredii TaxID=1506179 RepID=A0A9W9ER75_9EURO|nr:37S ribosomal protein S19 [Penicillium alfredii]KAJ5086523.1 37S ribosomal protein S19 [Penicillium alfredii]